MSEQQDPRPTALDYECPGTGSIPLDLYRGRYWPGLVAGGLLLLSAALPPAFLFSILFAFLQIAYGVARERDDAGRLHCRILPKPLLFGIVMVLLPIGAVVGLVAVFNASMERANRMKCASNLRQIGEGIAMYASANTGAYPPSLIHLLADFDSRVFVCWSSGDTEATGPTTQAITAALAQPGHMSYIYLGAGMHRSSVAPNTVIAHERLENHDKDGMNVLYGDGQVRWLSRREAEHLLNELMAGRNPPR